MPQEEPKCFGGLSLKNGLLIIMGLGILLSVSATFTGQVISGPISILLNIYGIYGVWNELAQHIKIFGMVKLVWLVISNLLDFVFYAQHGFYFPMFTVQVFNDFIDGPKILGQLDLKTVLLVVIAFGVIIAIVGIFTGSLILGLISLLVNLYGIYGIWYELALHVKIFGIIKLIALIVVNIVDIVFFVQYGATGGMVAILILNDIFDCLILYGIYIFYKHISGRGKTVSV
ncbi:hypothetical protein HDV04_001005 [Boothiomyces sp. JEL0838]|nr:hypothetical protein HDV04_001005 [Boothiomyces sp. JEL0838]